MSSHYVINQRCFFTGSSGRGQNIYKLQWCEISDP